MCRLHWISARTAWLFVGSLGVAACRRRLQGQVCGDIARRRGARRVFLLCLFASEDTIEPDGRPRRANTLLAARYRSKHIDAAYVCPKKAAEAHHGHTRCLERSCVPFRHVSPRWSWECKKMSPLTALQQRVRKVRPPRLSASRRVRRALAFGGTTIVAARPDQCSRPLTWTPRDAPCVCSVAAPPRPLRRPTRASPRRCCDGR